MIYFVGAGSGAPDLITVRGAKLLGEADVIVYAGSLVNPALLEYKKEGCEVYDSAKMTLEEVIAVMAPAAQAGKTVVRLHTGDQCVYGAHREQMDALDRLGLVAPSGSTFTAWLGFLKALGEALIGEWAQYRQALRDLPEQDGFPFSIVWPSAPGSEAADAEAEEFAP